MVTDKVRETDKQTTIQIKQTIKIKMSSTVIKIEDLKIENIRLSPVKVNKKGGKTVYINYKYNNHDDPKKLRFQLPSMKAPFGISGWSIGSDGKPSSIPNEESNDSIELAFPEKECLALQKLEELEEFIMKHAADNSKEYFNKKKTLDVCRMFFTTGIKHTLDGDGVKNDKYPPRIRCKMNKTPEHTYNIQIYDSKKQKTTMDIWNYNSVIPKMSDCSTIIECSGTWIVGEKFGISFRPAQMKVKKNEMILNDYAFIDEENEENEENEETESVVEDDLPIETQDKLNDLTLDEEETIDPLEEVSSKRRTRK
jgi:hypothetical protein